MKRTLLFICILAGIHSHSQARSSSLRGLFGGAGTGALIGGLAGGGRGAGYGALAGGVVGTAIGASKDANRRHRYREADYPNERYYNEYDGYQREASRKSGYARNGYRRRR